MTYTLNFISKLGLWELRVNRFRIRFYCTRDEAMKTVIRYRHALQSEADRQEEQPNYQEERDSYAFPKSWGL